MEINPLGAGRDSGQVDGACPSRGDTWLTLSLSFRHEDADPLVRHLQSPCEVTDVCVVHAIVHELSCYFYNNLCLRCMCDFDFFDILGGNLFFIFLVY